ncbi:MAG: hypothetical protein ACREK5_10780 [Gemmatimonadota bacterium]
MKTKVPETYTWVPPGEPGAWGEFWAPSYLHAETVVWRSVYAEPTNIAASVASALERELAGWTFAGKRTAARIDEYIDLLEDVEGEER